MSGDELRWHRQGHHHSHRRHLVGVVVDQGHQIRRWQQVPRRRKQMRPWQQVPRRWQQMRRWQQVPWRLQMRRKNEHHRKGPVGQRLRQPARFEGRFEHFSPAGSTAAALRSRGRYDMTLPGSRVACSAHHIPYNALANEEDPVCGARCVPPWSGYLVSMAPTFHRNRLARQIGRNGRPWRPHLEAMNSCRRKSKA